MCGAVTGSALAPLATRYGHWLGLAADRVREDRAEAAAEVRALPLLIRMERGRPPSWHTALALAATGAAAVCLDPRAEPGGEWHDRVAAYCAGHIRKVARRGRGAQWEATADLPEVSLSDGDTEVRALLPGLVTELAKRVAKLQVGGTDVEIDAPRPGPADPAAVLQIWLPPEPVMTMGKAMAQTGHAGMIAGALLGADDPAALNRWAAAGFPAHVHGRSAAFPDLIRAMAEPATAWRDGRWLAVRDAGFTEVDPGTITVVARAPRFTDPR